MTTTRFDQGHSPRVDASGEHVRHAVDACDDGCFSRREGVAFPPRQYHRLVGFFENDGVERVARVLEERVRVDGGADTVEFLDCEGVEWVDWNVGGVLLVARGLRGLFDSAVLGGVAPWGGGGDAV